MTIQPLKSHWFGRVVGIIVIWSRCLPRSGLFIGCFLCGRRLGLCRRLLRLLHSNKQPLSRIMLRHLLLSMLSRLDSVLAIRESARESGKMWRTDCDELLMHGKAVIETLAVNCLLERPDRVALRLHSEVGERRA